MEKDRNNIEMWFKKLQKCVKKKVEKCDSHRHTSKIIKISTMTRAQSSTQCDIVAGSE